MKGRVRHIVPLSSQALLLFQCQRQITGHTELVFHTPNHRGSGGLSVMSNGCLSMLLRRMGFQGRQTPHGFRGFGQTNCIEQLKIARVVTEKQLAPAGRTPTCPPWQQHLCLPEAHGREMGTTCSSQPIQATSPSKRQAF